MKNNYLVQAWLVLTLAVVFGAALSGVDSTLSERIKNNKINETYGQIPKLVGLGDRTLDIKEVQTPDGKVAYKAFDDDKHVGWVIKASGSGFADTIEILIGMDATATKLKGIYVLSQKETPALGEKIKEIQFRKCFVDLDATRKIVLTKAQPVAEDNEIKAITGATVSSASVTDIVNKATAEFSKRMGELEPKGKD